MTYEEIIVYWKKMNIRTEAELETALHSYCIDFAFHSGKIENEHVTYHDTREIFDKGRVISYTGDLRTLFEIQNSKNAYEKILKAFEIRQPIDESFVKSIQKSLTKGTYDQRRYDIGERPGEYKHHDYIVGKNEVGALADDVPEEMEELLSDLTEINEKNVLTGAAFFHAKFENIHPFSDGNGRTGRLLMNYMLLLNHHPPIVIHEEDRRLYYSALNCFDEKLDLEPLKVFLKQQTVKTWEKTVAIKKACTTN